MSDLSKKYKEIVSDIEARVSNSEELEFVKCKIADLSMLFVDIIDRVTEMTDYRIEELEETQEKLEQKLAKIQNSLDGIENDIYEDDNYDFEIVCPYCNHEFVAEIESEMKEEVECPECHNMIELDWNEECEEEGCHHCDGGCFAHLEDNIPSLEEVVEEKKEKNDEDNDEEEDEEDDM